MSNYYYYFFIKKVLFFFFKLKIISHLFLILEIYKLLNHLRTKTVGPTVDYLIINL